jgi:hypothetical protein
VVQPAGLNSLEWNKATRPSRHLILIRAIAQRQAIMFGQLVEAVGHGVLVAIEVMDPLVAPHRPSTLVA